MNRTNTTKLKKNLNFSLKLTPHQLALSFSGNEDEEKSKQTKFQKWKLRHNKKIELITSIVVISFIVFSLIIDVRLLFIFPAIGAIIFYRNNFEFWWWKIKVFILYRSFYEHRRELYIQGTLKAHLLDSRKQPKKFSINGKKIIVWASSKKLQIERFNRISKSEKLTSKEYIKL